MSALRVRYHTVEFDDVDIHVRCLRDRNEFRDDQGEAEALGIDAAAWPLFGVLWPAGKVLAHLMSVHDVAEKQVLELGCGIGLSSLVLNHRRAEVTATDHHPEAGSFLRQNVALNGGRPIPFVRTAWADDVSALGVFDLIIGSDVLYDVEQNETLAGFIDKHARANCEVIIVDPGDGPTDLFSDQMARLGYVASGHTPRDIKRLAKLGDLDDPAAPFKGQILHFSR